MIKHQEEKRIRVFFRDYVDESFKNPRNVIRLSKGQPEHNKRVCEICCLLLEKGIVFYTEVRLKAGVRPDILCPGHILPIIEVFHTEDEKEFNLRKKPKYPYELLSEIIFNRTKNKLTWFDIN